MSGYKICFHLISPQIR